MKTIQCKLSKSLDNGKNKYVAIKYNSSETFVFILLLSKVLAGSESLHFERIELIHGGAEFINIITWYFHAKNPRFASQQDPGTVSHNSWSFGFSSIWKKLSVEFMIIIKSVAKSMIQIDVF